MLTAPIKKGHHYYYFTILPTPWSRVFLAEVKGQRSAGRKGRDSDFCWLSYCRNWVIDWLIDFLTADEPHTHTRACANTHFSLLICMVWGNLSKGINKVLSDQEDRKQKTKPILVAFCKINEKLKIKKLILVKGTTNLKINQSYIKIGYRVKTRDVNLWVSHN